MSPSISPSIWISPSCLAVGGTSQGVAIVTFHIDSMARVLFASVLSFDNDKRLGLFQTCLIIGPFPQPSDDRETNITPRLNMPEATQCLSPSKFLTAPAHPFSTL